MKKILLAALVLFSLPALLHIYQPAWQLGGWGLILGGIGFLISPILLFGTMLYVVALKWK
jgi:hypothetical protein